MYETFYGLKEKPFALTPDPQFLYPSPQHVMALTLLEYGLEQHSGFILITGEVGSGKTTLIRQLLGRIADDVTVGLISNTHRAFGPLMQWVLLAFGLDYKAKEDAALFQTFTDFLIEEYRRRRRVLLIVDEAQNLGTETLEELRVLSNINADKDFVLQTILVGQPELRATLRAPAMRQLAQRISVDYHLKTLARCETYAYVRHRLEVAGGSPDIIAREAIEFVHGGTGGVPRLINSLCDSALVYGFAEQRRTIDAELMAQVIRDRAAGGVLPLVAPETALASELR
jgi:putative secretion ATPase (PEP-CTERM system associated)